MRVGNTELLDIKSLGALSNYFAATHKYHVGEKSWVAVNWVIAKDELDAVIKWKAKVIKAQTEYVRIFHSALLTKRGKAKCKRRAKRRS
jgi:hypothetical protein